MMSDRLHPRALPLTALAVGLGLVLAGCGGTDEEPPGQDEGQEDGAAGDEQGSEEDPAGGEDEGSAGEAFAQAQLADAAGNDLGQVTFTETDGGVQVQADVQDLAAGFHGFHIHEIGLCEPQSENDAGEMGDFFSAGGHLAGEGEDDLGVVEGEEAPETENVEEEEMPDVDADAHAEVHHPDHAGDLPNLMVAQDGTAQLSVVTDRLTPELLTAEDGAAVIVHSQPDNHGNVPERYAPGGPDEDTLATGDAGERTACGVIEDS